LHIPIEKSILARSIYRAFAIAATILSVTVCGWAGETVLYSFPGGANGSNPQGVLAMDSSGNLYGTTFGGGLNGNCSAGFCGVVYELSPSVGGGWTQTVLYSFKGTTDGGNPQAGVILDSAGNLYGTTVEGGDTSCSAIGCGTVYELVRGTGGTWTEKILYGFTGGADGGNPIAGLVFDSAGNLYGTTSAWGDLGGCSGNGCGSVFELSPGADGTWTETTLHTFSHIGRDGNDPAASLVIDAHGNLFGTTALGGLFPNYCSDGCGTVFELRPAVDGSFDYGVIYRFGATSTDGEGPVGGILLGPEGSLYGTTNVGGSGSSGAVWEISGSGTGLTETILYSFPGGGTDGLSPTSTMAFSPRGELYGTTESGGNSTSPGCPDSCGTIFRLTHTGTTWTASPPFRFDGPDGARPGNSGLIRDAAGDFYGVTANGGSTGSGVSFDGVVFKITP
jgi:hypothetical protein